MTSPDTAPAKVLPLTTCACGHPRERHSRGRGTCFECYGASDHGLKPYCCRIRRPAKEKV